MQCKKEDELRFFLQFIDTRIDINLIHALTSINIRIYI